MRRLDLRAVGTGAAVATVIALPAAIAGNVAGDADSPLVVPLFLAVLGAFVAGGYVGGRIGRSAPFSHSAVAAALAWAVVSVASVVVGLVRGDPVVLLASGGDRDEIVLVGILANGLAAYACGLVGGLVANRNRARPAGADPS